MNFWEWYLITTYGLSVVILALFWNKDLWEIDIIIAITAPISLPICSFVFGYFLFNNIRDRIWPEEHKNGKCRSWRHLYKKEDVYKQKGTNKYIGDEEITEKKWVRTIHTCLRCGDTFTVENT